MYIESLTQAQPKALNTKIQCKMGNKSHNLSFNSSRVVWRRSEQLCCHLFGGHVQAQCQAVMFEGEEKSAVQRIVSTSSRDFKLRPNRRS